MKCETKLLKRFLEKKKNRVILNIISILMMCSGPILMILPGPQVISWIGLFLFIYANYDLLIKYKWFRKLVLNLKIMFLKRKVKERKWVYFKER